MSRKASTMNRKLGLKWTQTPTGRPKIEKRQRNLFPVLALLNYPRVWRSVCVHNSDHSSHSSLYLQSRITAACWGRCAAFPTTCPVPSLLRLPFCWPRWEVNTPWRPVLTRPISPVDFTPNASWLYLVPASCCVRPRAAACGRWSASSGKPFSVALRSTRSCYRKALWTWSWTWRSAPSAPAKPAGVSRSSRLPILISISSGIQPPRLLQKPRRRPTKNQWRPSTKAQYLRAAFPREHFSQLYVNMYGPGLSKPGRFHNFHRLSSHPEKFLCPLML